MLIRFAGRLTEAETEPSVGSKSDSYNNTTTETTTGLYKVELLHRSGPRKTREAVELTALGWVSWFNHHPLLEPIGHIPQAEVEANYRRQQEAQAKFASGHRGSDGKVAQGADA